MITLVGINHRSAPVAQREALAFDRDQALRFLAEARAGSLLHEGVLLSTCNRTEVYATQVADPQRLIGALSRFKTSAEPGARAGDALAPAPDLFYVHRGKEAARHLLRVAAGLDSMVLGENEILGQVRDAYRQALEAGSAATVLDRLFSSALQAGKRVRAETRINRGASSVSQAAVELCAGEFESLASHPVLLLGAGENGRLALQTLVKRGVRRILVANRTRSRADDLAARFSAEAIPLEDLGRALEECDVALTSTSSPAPLITRAAVEQALESRGGRRLLLIDLSVPRNVEQAVRDLEPVSLFDMDDLHARVRGSQAGRRGEVKKAEAIVETATDAFALWLGTLELRPLIADLRGRLERARDAEVALAAGGRSEAAAVADSLTRRIHGLIVRNMRRMAEEGRLDRAVQIVRELFDLETRR